jgi:hypothetical protein
MPCAHDAFVPIPRNPEHASGKGVDALIDFALLCPWPNEVLRFDLSEQGPGLYLGIEQTSS